ncbi:hypothetical protein [Actinomycetospora chibensis]|uniref:Uncharacterized protein n=1 Tax=Actinomycetospora chibensis TaxID=663606 RepID=A0ABV9RMK3_9PSEU|nr:hypothetical protein [Actinomycetospora chibensis]MDD7922828.1 hypothetical protein [Actinomycetospora chibensis]
MGPDGGPVAAPPRCHGGGGPAEPPEEDVDSPAVSGVGDDSPGVGSVPAASAWSRSAEPLSSSTACTRVVDSAFGLSVSGAGSSVLVRTPPLPDVSDDGAWSGSSGLLGVLTRTRLVGR